MFIVLNRSLLDLSGRWLSSKKRSYLFKFQCGDFPDLVKNSANLDELLLNVMDYCEEYYLGNKPLAVEDSKRFIARVLNVIFGYYHDQFPIDVECRYVIDADVKRAIKSLYEAIQPFADNKRKEIEENKKNIKLEVYKGFLVVQGSKEKGSSLSIIPSDAVKVILGKFYSNNSCLFSNTIKMAQDKKEPENAKEPENVRQSSCPIQ